MKKLTLMGVLALLCLYGNAQSPPIQALQVGDTVPNLVLATVYDPPTGTTTTRQLSDYAGKAILLDFWGTWCIPCWKAFPKLDSLYQNTALQVLTVNAEPLSKLQQAFFGTKPWTQTLSFPFITNDTLLNQYFPHRMVPHAVWIDAGGVVQAITGGEEITTENIGKLIQGRRLQLPLKWEDMDFDRSRPLLDNNNGGAPTSYRFRSLFTHRLEGVKGFTGHRKEMATEQHRYYYVNKPLTVFLAMAYKEEYRQARNSWVLEGDTLQLKQWLDEAAAPVFCYELILPVKEQRTTIAPYLQQDLERYLGITLRQEGGQYILAKH